MGGIQELHRKIDNTRQTNERKMVHNWIHDEQQQDLFAKETQFTQYPVECGKIEYHQHDMACYAPPMIIKKKCMNKLIKTWKGLNIATLIVRALKYIITCVISVTKPLQHKYTATASSFDTMVFQAWIEQIAIRQGQIFNGRIRSKCAEAEGHSYASNPEIRDVLRYGSYILASKTIHALVEIALELYVTMNKQLHDITPDEQRKI